MKEKDTWLDPTGDELLAVFATLANPHRFRILAVLARGGRQYVSQLARDLAMSRPLLHVHLKRLAAAGLVSTSLELSKEGRAMRYVAAAQFAYRLTPAAVARADRTLSDEAFEMDQRGKHRRRPDPEED